MAPSHGKREAGFVVKKPRQGTSRGNYEKEAKLHWKTLE